MIPTTIYEKWRVVFVHIVAKLLGVLVHIEGVPFGSSRIFLASQAGRPGVNGGSKRSTESAFE